MADTAVKSATVDVVGCVSPGNGGTSHSMRLFLFISGDSGAVSMLLFLQEKSTSLLGSLADTPVNGQPSALENGGMNHDKIKTF